MHLSHNLLHICLLFLIVWTNSASGARKHFTSAPANKYAAPWIGQTFAGGSCRGEPQGYGPYDYRKRNILFNELKLVEGAHFTLRVETLRKGKTAIDPYQDIYYTIRAWPNHHRALNSITRYFMLAKASWDRRKLPPECFFQRAINFANDDETTFMLYANYLHKVGKLKLADENYKKALELDPENMQANYNYGLLLVKLKKYKKARDAAKKAYNQSYPLPGLKNKLKNVGYWP